MSARDTRFKPGQSGNPGGRPKADPEVREIFKAATPAVARKLISLALNEPGDVPYGHQIAAEQAVLDRALGKPEQQHRVSGQIDFAHLLGEYSQLLALEEAGEVQVLDVIDGHAIDDDAKANGNGAA